MQHPVQKAPWLRLLEAFEHPDIEWELCDGGEEALAVGMEAESGDTIHGGRKINGREKLFRARLHVHRIELPLRAVAGGVLEDAVELAAVLREPIGQEFA